MGCMLSPKNLSSGNDGCLVWRIYKPVCVTIDYKAMQTALSSVRRAILRFICSWIDVKDLWRTSAPAESGRADYKSGICQSISGLSAALSAALILEKGRLPKNPLAAESGDGCAD